MNAETTLFYDVDTQRDFILPGGKLYIPGTETIIPKLKELTELARQQNIRIVCSVDRHFPGDIELKRNGGEWPDHCMDGTEGQKKIAETAPLNPLHIENNFVLSPEQVQAAMAHKGELVFEKQHFDILVGNRHAHSVLRLLLEHYKDIVVYGVFTEVCVDHAINLLAGLGPKVTVVSDAIAYIGRDADAVRARWQQMGIELIKLDDLKTRLLS